MYVYTCLYLKGLVYGHVYYIAESKEGKKDERNQGTKNWKKKLTTKNGESERKKERERDGKSSRE